MPTRAEADVENEEVLKLLQWLTSGDNTVHASEWAYETRRSSQAILPFLFLGPFTTAKDVDFITKKGITLLLVIRDSRSALSGLLSGKKVAEQLGIQHAAVDVGGSAQLIQYGFPDVIRIINNHLLAKYQECALHGPLPSGPPFETEPPTRGKVLIFCESGNERSAAAVASYLMAMYQVDMVSAVQYVQTQRFCIALNDELKHLLLNFQQLLEARRGVLKSQVSDGLPANKGKITNKRNIEEVDKDDDDMDDDSDSDDSDRFQKRKNYAPFVDQ
jgi:serine/threonine/tyrosine-interacting protein